jgi:hypothetical protein
VKRRHIFFDCPFNQQFVHGRELEACNRLVCPGTKPHSRLSAAADPPYIQAMRTAGAAAFVTKTATDSAIFEATRSIAHPTDADVTTLSMSVHA